MSGRTMSVAPAVTAYGLKRLAAKSIQRQGAALMEAYTCTCMGVRQSKDWSICLSRGCLTAPDSIPIAPAEAWPITGPARSMPPGTFFAEGRGAMHFLLTQGSHLLVGTCRQLHQAEPACIHLVMQGSHLLAGTCGQLDQAEPVRAPRGPQTATLAGQQGPGALYQHRRQRLVTLPAPLQVQ